jgi:hypothetical protein
MASSTLPSVIRRLLQEVSWDGRRVKYYRQGGLGLENVLTAEVLQGLDFLPRQHFFIPVISAFNGKAERVKASLIAEVESVSLGLLPPSIPFRANQDESDPTQFVNPDGMLMSGSVFALIEAKRIKSSSFQTEQLAREFVATIREAQNRLPLLILLLGHEPPVMVGRKQRKTIHSAIIDELATVLTKMDSPYDIEALQGKIDDVVVWITWDQIAEIIGEQLSSFSVESLSVRNAVERVALSVISAIKMHR